MEKLLNKLIEKGWKPFGDENVKEIKIYSDMDMECIYGKKKSDFYYFSPRKITSKESGLWQFVCENGLIPEDKMRHERVLDLTFGPYGPDVSAQMCSRNYEYWLMSSSLYDENKLEQFLIENIKV